jgi:hypothetical protein
MILCDFQDDDSGTERCKSKATRFLLRCIHPPSPNYNQYDGDAGTYLGPQPEPDLNFPYDPKDARSEIQDLSATSIVILPMRMNIISEYADHGIDFLTISAENKLRRENQQLLIKTEKIDIAISRISQLEQQLGILD